MERKSTNSNLKYPKVVVDYSQTIYNIYENLED